MSDFSSSEAARLLTEHEKALDEREAQLAAAERAIDDLWEDHERRMQALDELRQYVREREDALIRRAADLSLGDDILSDLIGGADRVGVDEIVLGEEEIPVQTTSQKRRDLVDERKILCGQRDIVIGERNNILASSDSMCVQVESALLAQEHRVAKAFQQILESKSSPDTPMDETPTAPTSLLDDNRRNCQRIELHVSVDVDSQHNFYYAKTANIGIGGLFVATRQLLPAGRQVVLDLNLPGEGPIKVRGRVTWRREIDTASESRGYGVRFDELDSEAKAVVARFVAKREPGAALTK